MAHARVNKVRERRTSPCDDRSRTTLPENLDTADKQLNPGTDLSRDGNTAGSY